MIRKTLNFLLIGLSLFSLSACSTTPSTITEDINLDDENINAAYIPEDDTEKELIGMANPASVYCEENGGTLEIRNRKGSAGFCVFEDGSECEEWAFYSKECEPGDNIDSETELSQLSQEEKISMIKKNYSEVNNNLSNYKKTEKDILDESTEGGHAIFYKQQDGEDYFYRKITEEYLGEMGKTAYEFYFDKDGSLSFILEQEFSYNAPMYVEDFDEEQTNVVENRYYFYEGNMIQWIGNNKKNISDDIDEYLEKQAYWLKYSREMTRIIEAN